MIITVKETVCSKVAYDLENGEAKISFIHTGLCFEIRIVPKTDRVEKLIEESQGIEQFSTLYPATKRIEQLMGEKLTSFILPEPNDRIIKIFQEAGVDMEK